MVPHTVRQLVLHGVIFGLYRYHPKSRALTLVSSEYHFVTVFDRTIDLGELDTVSGIVQLHNRNE